MHPPPASARPSSAIGSRASPQEPVKVYKGPSPMKRPASATPGGGANRLVRDDKC
jgi:hypothetical protein